MTNIITAVLGPPLIWIYNATGNYGLSIFLYILTIRILFILFDYLQYNMAFKYQISKPFLWKAKEQFLGKDGDKFTNCSLEILNATKASKMANVLPIIITYPIYVSIFYIFYHPISVLIPSLIPYLKDLTLTAKTISTNMIDECNIISAYKMNPAAFTGIDADLSILGEIKTELFGIDVTKTASLDNISVLIPAFTVLFFVINIILLLIPVITKKKHFKEILIQFALYLIAGTSIAMSSFMMPVIFHIYFIIFAMIGYLSRIIVRKTVCKNKNEWVKNTKKACMEILEKYGIKNMEGIK